MNITTGNTDVATAKTGVPWEPIIQGGSGFLSSIINAFSGKKRAKEAYQRQRQLIEEERAYNDPSAQMERYRKAGINPMLALSKNSSMQNTVSSSGKSVAMAPPVNMQLGQVARESLMLAEQLRNLRADTGKKESETKYTEQKTANETVNQQLLGGQVTLQQQEILKGQILLQEKAGSYSLYETALRNANRIQSATVNKLLTERAWMKDKQKQTVEQTANIKQTRQLIIAQTKNLLREYNIKGYEKQMAKFRAVMLTTNGMTIQDDQLSRMTYTMIMNQGDDPTNATLWAKVSQQVIGFLAGVISRRYGGPVRSLNRLKSKTTTTRKIGKDRRSVTKMNYE